MIETKEHYSKYSSYSHPLYATFKRVLDSYKTNPSDARSNLEDSIEVLIKYITLFFYSGYKFEDKENPKINKLLPNLLVPSLGSYTQLLTMLSEQMSKSEYDLFSLTASKLQDEVPENVIVALENLSSYTDIDGLAPTRKKEQIYLRVIGSLVQYRNKTRGHGATEKYENIKHILDNLYIIVTQLLDTFKEIFLYELITVTQLKRDDDGFHYDIIRWHGASQQVDVYSNNDDLLNIGLTYLAVSIDEEDVFLCLSPFLMSPEQETYDEIYFLNDSKKSYFEFLAYASGKKTKAEKVNGKFFNKVFNLLDEFKSVISEGYRKPLIIEQASVNLYNDATVLYKSNSFEPAVHNLYESISLSPSYVLAINFLVKVLSTNNKQQEAISVVLNYLDYMSGYPEQIDKELFSKFIVLLCDEKDFNQAIGYMEAIGKEIYGEESVLTFLNDLQENKTPHFDFVDYLDVDDKKYYLPYDFIRSFVFGYNSISGAANEQTYDIDMSDQDTGSFFRRLKTYFKKILNNSYLVMNILIILTTFITSTVLRSFGEALLGITVLCLGIFWLTNINSVYVFRKMISSSRSNFCSFIKSLQDDEEEYYRQFSKMFGMFEPNSSRYAYLSSVIKCNKFRLFLILLTSFLISLMIYNATFFVSYILLAKVLFFIFVFLVYFDFCYLASCIFSYSGIIKSLSKEQINFTLVQHPKLSIKYLAILTEKFIITILVTYIFGVSILYIGPFKQNMLFMFSLTALMLSQLFVYYKIIFMVYSAVNKNKWDKIVKLSNRFVMPFNNMIDKGRLSDLNRLNELNQIREFIQKYNALPVSKVKLLFVTVLLFVIVLGVPVVASNIFPNIIVPIITKKIDKTSSKNIHKEVLISKDGYLNISVDDVDDTFVILYKSDKNGANNKLDADIFDRNEMFIRCDWGAAGEHGNMKVNIPKVITGENQEILLIAYNKVYHGKFLFGGGKLSYNYKVTDKTDIIDEHTLFIRDNEKGIKAVKYIVLEPVNDRINFKIETNIDKMPPHILKRIKYFEEKLSLEKDTKLF